MTAMGDKRTCHAHETFCRSWTPCGHGWPSAFADQDAVERWTRSLGLDVGGLDHFRPLRNLTLDRGREFRGCAADQVETNIEQALAYLGHRQHAQGLPVDLVDDRGRRPGGRHQA